MRRFFYAKKKPLSNSNKIYHCEKSPVMGIQFLLVSYSQKLITCDVIPFSGITSIY